MQLDIETLMLGFFILFLTLSIWKIWAFLPNKRLKDDDTTLAAQEELLHIMLNKIDEYKGELNAGQLLQAMKDSKEFDSKKFWRFNLNKLNHLLQTYYLQNPDTQSIQAIYEKLKP